MKVSKKMFSILGIAVTLFFGYSFYNDLNKEEVPQTISIENCKIVIEKELQKLHSLIPTIHFFAKPNCFSD